ncbi:MAG: polyamine aminopropyltransferase [Calditrichaeota bacterium]|nr:MAG: polyamine aminopropyltransferase [Calditrichota bacterium]
MSLRFTEEYPEINGAFSFEVTRVLYTARSPFQKIEIVETTHLGKVLLLDDLVMFTEKDEFVYHEMISHVPLFVHPEPKRILVVGGGDGGTVRECLRHDTVERIDLVEIDEMVSQACIQYVPSLAGKLLSDKVNCRFLDAVEYVRKTSETYDVILIDSTDPVSVGEGLFTREFYRNCFNCLTDHGVLVAQSESPAWAPELVQSISRKLRAVFPNVHFYQAHIPTYPSGHWAFAFASKTLHPLKDYQEERYRNAGLSFKYYNSDLHFGAFALPTFFRELVDAV